MTKTGSGQWCSVARIAGGLLAGLLAVRASAAQKVWTGGGADDTFSDDPMEKLLKGGWNGDV